MCQMAGHNCDTTGLGAEAVEPGKAATTTSLS